jgi:hypothetical protein
MRSFAVRPRTVALAAGTFLVAAALWAAAASGSSASAGKKQAQVAETVAIPGLSLDSEPSPQNPAPTGTATSTCPKGTKLALGGFTGGGGPDPTDPGITLTDLQRPSKRDWSVSALNLNGGAGNLTSLAYCSKVKKLTEAVGSATITPSGTGTATATCPPKKSVRLGGFSGEVNRSGLNPAVVATGLRLASKRTLQVEAVNVSEDTAGSLDAIAYCGKGPKLKTKAAAVSIPQGGHAGATAECPKRKPVAFGGFDVEIDLQDSDPITIIEGLERLTKRTWTASGIALGDQDAGPGQVTSYAYCAKHKKK